MHYIKLLVKKRFECFSSLLERFARCNKINDMTTIISFILNLPITSGGEPHRAASTGVHAHDEQSNGMT